MSRGSVFKPSYTYKGEKRESRVWWIDFSVDGERRRESAKTEDKRVAERFLTRRLREFDVYGPRETDYSDVRLADLAELIRTDYEKNGHRSEVENRLSHLESFFGQGFRVARLRGPQVDAYVTGRLEEGAANATVNRELAALRRMFNLGEKAGLVVPGGVPDVVEQCWRKTIPERASFRPTSSGSS